MKTSKEIYADLDEMVVTVQKDPFALGPNYINEGMSDCHRYIEKVASYIREIGAAQFVLKKDIMLCKKAQKLEKDPDKLERIEQLLEEKQTALFENTHLDSSCRMKLQLLKSSLTSLKFQWDMVSVSLGSNIADTEKKIQRKITPKDFLENKVEDEEQDEEEPDELSNLDPDKSSGTIPVQSIEKMLEDL